jgi:hypothetical protein
VDRGGTVDMTLSVRNESDQTVRVPVSASQRYDFEVWQGSRLIWRSSAGRDSTGRSGTLVMEPGQAATFSDTWDLRNTQRLRVPAGRYTVKAFMRSTAGGGTALVALSTLTVTGR